jgi:predicted O-methyltransferase YrrM
VPPNNDCLLSTSRRACLRQGDAIWRMLVHVQLDSLVRIVRGGREIGSSVGDVVGRFLTGLRTVNLASLSLWRRPGKLMEFMRRTDMLLLSYSLAPLLSTSLSDLLRDGSPSEVFVPFRHVKPGSTPLADLTVLAALTREKCPRKVFEIGTFEGLSAVVFVSNSDSSVKVLTLDLPPAAANELLRTERSWQAQSIGSEYDSGYLIGRFDANGRVVRLLGDSALIDFKPYQGQIDLFFIDGAHTEDYVARDSLNAFHTISADGWVVWHDCLVPQVASVLRQIAKHHAVYHIAETNLAIAFGKPSANFPWQILNREFR